MATREPEQVVQNVVRTSRADLNWLSGTPEGWTLFAGSDHPMPTAAPVAGGSICPPNPQQYDAILKTSRMKGLRLFNISVAQGRENSLDANAGCEDCIFSGDFGLGGGEGDQVITTKGRCRWLSYVGTIHSEGRNAHVVCGQWSDQSHDLTTDIDYSRLRHVTGKPLTFVLVRCKRVTLPPGAKVLWCRSLLNRAYWWLKFAAVKLGLFK